MTGSLGGGALLALGYGAVEEQAPIYLAHHALVIALPFVVPVVIVIAMVAVVAWRDRHRPVGAEAVEVDASDALDPEADEGSLEPRDATLDSTRNATQDSGAKDGALR